jgi:hypothetical protein
MGRNKEVVKRSGRDEPMWVSTHYMNRSNIRTLSV